jgi:hypothetical protein
LTPHHLALAATRRNETSETEAKKAEQGRFGHRGFWLDLAANFTARKC